MSIIKLERSRKGNLASRAKGSLPGGQKYDLRSSDEPANARIKFAGTVCND